MNFLDKAIGERATLGGASRLRSLMAIRAY